MNELCFIDKQHEISLNEFGSFLDFFRNPSSEVIMLVFSGIIMKFQSETAIYIFENEELLRLWQGISYTKTSMRQIYLQFFKDDQCNNTSEQLRYVEKYFPP